MQEGRRRVCAQVRNHAVVGQDVKLARREQHAQEPVVLGVGRIARGSAPFLRDAHGRGGAVVPVRDIRGRHGGEGASQRSGFRHAPYRVSDAVVAHEVGERRGLLDSGDQAVDLGAVAVQQEHRTGLRVQLPDVAGAVAFLVLARLLVRLDRLAEVVVHGAARDHAALRVMTHDLAVQVETGG